MERLDQYLVALKPDLSRATIARLIEQGKATVNGEQQLKPSYKVREEDKITLDSSSLEQTIPKIDLPVIYEDDDCVVINKPVGLLTHSKGAFNPEATVATWLHSRVKGLSNGRDGIVHRLDRATSGVMIVAKSIEAQSWLQKQFSSRKAKKKYIALVEGVPKEPEAVIDMPIERNPKKPQTFRVGNNGKSAITAYKVLDSSGRQSRIELAPTTGRTHQLRVHLKQIGNPIVGDILYGGRPADRLFLHALSLEITLPNRQRQTFEVPLPAEFKVSHD